MLLFAQMLVERFSVLLKKEPGNIFILTLISLQVLLYVTAVSIKWTIDIDGIADSLKLILVCTYITNFYSIVWQKRECILEYSSKLPLIFGGFFILLTSTVAFNWFLISAEIHNDDFYALNNDNFTLGITIGTDLMYLIFYFYFKSFKALALTSFLLVIEVIVMGVSQTLDSDAVIDTMNLTVMMVTSFMALFLWSGKIAIVDGRARFYDLSEREDLMSENKDMGLRLI
jgi:hypothetical protein